eukprot:TRINITY_DN2677_c0_g1_i8.p1 TRINITY_DN2677_c0_g1~~TRINITY_DN2677_c0_g1_i8.p1  ORF type:complete len:148 (+),score=11.90 TRINITY_DN2677_c0_g1_i8:90-533(+)
MPSLVGSEMCIRDRYMGEMQLGLIGGKNSHYELRTHKYMQKDLHFRADQFMRLGINGNRLQKHFRHQCPLQTISLCVYIKPSYWLGQLEGLAISTSVHSQFCICINFVMCMYELRICVLCNLSLQCVQQYRMRKQNGAAYLLSLIHI